MENSLTGIMDQVHSNAKMVTVTRAQYADWQHGFIFDGLRSLSYGQSFCHRFGIRDHVLNRSTSGYEKDPYIRKLYVR